MLAFGLPLIPAAAALWGVAFLDRVMLSQLPIWLMSGSTRSPRASPPSSCWGSPRFGLAFSPFLSHCGQRIRTRSGKCAPGRFTYLSVVLACLSLVLGLFAREMILVVAPDFEGGSRTGRRAVHGRDPVRDRERRDGRDGARAPHPPARRVLPGRSGREPATRPATHPSARRPWGRACRRGRLRRACRGYDVQSQRLYPTLYAPWKVFVALGVATARSARPAPDWRCVPGRQAGCARDLRSGPRGVQSADARRRHRTDRDRTTSRFARSEGSWAVPRGRHDRD